MFTLSRIMCIGMVAKCIKRFLWIFFMGIVPHLLFMGKAPHLMFIGCFPISVVRGSVGLFGLRL